MSMNWKQAIKALAGATVATALCVGGALAVETPVALAVDSVTVTNGTEFVDAIQCAAGDPGKTVTVAADLALTPGLLPDNKNDVNCPITIVSDGTEHSITWSGANSMLWVRSGLVTIGAVGDESANKLKFTAPDDSGKSLGPLFHNYGTLTIEGGTFTGLHATNGPVALNDGTMTVKGGTFSNNIADGNGGVIYSGGDKSVLTIQGAARFENNQAKANQWTAGGGAIWATHELRVKKDANGNAPTFDGNQALTEKPGADGKLGKGGAGGAIFFNLGTFYLTGGTFTNNQSGYLGGAVYTEEGSTTYVGKAVAFDNTAGHFGGGIWFCPSGNSAASKGGNIALFGNHVGSPKEDGTTIDANTDNDLTAHSQKDADTTQAGADLAIMNPYWKWVNKWIGASSNRFQLLDTWFIDRSSDAKAVTWRWDNVPLQHSSGYHDSWLPDATSNATHQLVNQGIDAVLATTNAGTDNHKNGDEQVPGLLQLQADDGVKDTSDIKWIRTGVALKAYDYSDADVAKAKTKAQVTMSGNQARLSGGAFGSDGVVLFDTPYSMSWEKIDLGENGKLDDTDKPVTAGSTWTLTATKLDEQDGVAAGSELPYNDADMRPTDCPTLDSTGTIPDSCWHKTKTDAAGKTYWTVDIEDNGPRDNDPSVGAFGVENLAPGTYALVEKEAPAGFQKTSNTYTFIIKKAVGGVITETPTLTLKTEPKDDDGKGPLPSAGDKNPNRIGNKRVEGKIDWTKTPVGGSTRIAGSEWHISHTKTDATGDKDVNVDVTDCVVSEVKQLCTVNGKEDGTKLLDQDPDGGGFDVDITGTTNGAYDWPDGEYTITETKAPAVYLLPADGSRSATFTITTATDSTTKDTVRKVEWKSGTGMDTTSGRQFENQPTEVAWEKVDSTDKTPLAGSSWTLTQTKDGDTDIAEGKRQSWTIEDCLKNATCKTTVPSDSDDEDGKFKVTGLKAGTYTLVEKGAPSGYELDDKTVYMFVITDQTTTVGTTVHIQQNSAAVADNKLPNTRTPVSSLPFTGGRSGLDWLIVGGGLALAASVAGLVYGRIRRREL